MSESEVGQCLGASWDLLNSRYVPYLPIRSQFWAVRARKQKLPSFKDIGPRLLPIGSGSENLTNHRPNPFSIQSYLNPMPEVVNTHHGCLSGLWLQSLNTFNVNKIQLQPQSIFWTSIIWQFNPISVQSTPYLSHIQSQSNPHHIFLTSNRFLIHNNLTPIQFQSTTIHFQSGNPHLNEIVSIDLLLLWLHIKSPYKLSIRQYRLADSFNDICIIGH